MNALQAMNLEDQRNAYDALVERALGAGLTFDSKDSKERRYVKWRREADAAGFATVSDYIDSLTNNKKVSIMRRITLFFAAVAASLGLTTAANAAPNSNFTGPKVEVTAGIDDVTNYRDAKVNYGIGAGVDLPLGDRLTIGAELNADNFASYRDFGADARLGVALTDNLLAYGKVGYANLRGLDGVRVGGGLEIASGAKLYGKLEYRYSDFQDGVGRHAGLVGVGLRF